MPPTPDLLFVYGTLRPALSVGRPRELVGDLEVVAAATVAGRLYDLGVYPGMVAGNGVVHGDLLRVRDDDRLAAIDSYEECGGPDALFRREAVTAVRADGTHAAAWAYFYAQPVGSARVIAHGDYARDRRPG
jgi:gamma-glutamylcyclotransferase (GGCT)/AIG2-like uncharacterized protein YtfP